MPQNAWVAFTGKTDIWWLRFLKKNYRHCFVVLNDSKLWMSIDPLAPYTNIQIYDHIKSDFDLPDWLRGQGYEVVSARLNKTHKRPAPLMFYSCVESVKRIWGLHAWHVITPWQLYKYLKTAICC